MLDITLFRNDVDFKRILESEKKRNRSTENAENVKKYDNLWKNAKSKKEELRAEKNKITKEIPELAKKGMSIESHKEKSKQLDLAIIDFEKKENEYLELRDKTRYVVGNILLDDVPYGKSEDDNKTIKTFGCAKVQKKHLDDFTKQLQGIKMDHKIMDFEPKSHVDLGIERDLFDLEKAAKVAGARAYYLKNRLMILHLSLMRFALDILIKKKYTPIYTPFFLNADVMAKAAELSDFAETLYKIDDSQFLIATAEQPLAAMHMDDILDKKNLPIKYAGFSSAFRKEVGSHSKDTRGIFRVHQFDKVEQYVFCLPEQSKKLHEDMMKNTEEIMQKLELPYRIINICSADMNDTAAKKYDIELWMPVQGKFREIGSGSITTDYQTRKLNVRYEENNERKIVHSLNCTAIPSPRILTAFFETHQDAKGIIHIPKALQKYTGFKEI